MVKGDVVKVVQEFFGAKYLLKELNAPFMVLNPKNSKGDLTDKFRPVSLCNSFYKIISKILTSRVLSVLHFIISPKNPRFVSKR